MTDANVTYTRAVATANALRQMRRHAFPEFLEKIWKTAIPDQLTDKTDKLVIAEETQAKCN